MLLSVPDPDQSAEDWKKTDLYQIWQEPEVQAFVKERLGSVKAPKQVEVWPDLPRSKVGKVLKTEVKDRLRAAAG